MSIGPLAALPASLAGQSLAQAHGSEVERAAQETVAQQLRTTGDKKAESAAGLGAMDEEGEEAHERDADGRRLWEDRLDLSHRSSEEDAGEEKAGEEKAGEEDAPADLPRPRDARSPTGPTFDITA